MKKIIIAGIALTLLGLACGEEDLTDPTPVNTPAVVLKNVELSFNERNITYLKESLSDDFVFYFDPDDVGQNPPGGSKYVIPETWPYAEFTGAVTKLYKNAYSVSLTIPTTNVGEPGANETIYNAENINIKLLVMVDEINGYIANAGYCNFEFERYDGSGGKKFWRVSRWWDRTYVEPPGDREIEET
ncbi:MAG TPA: hypothetical protein VMW93_09695, partial [bacterium]|nr:hypothetical protein [bacterium]